VNFTDILLCILAFLEDVVVAFMLFQLKRFDYQRKVVLYLLDLLTVKLFRFH